MTHDNIVSHMKKTDNYFKRNFDQVTYQLVKSKEESNVTRKEINLFLHRLFNKRYASFLNNITKLRNFLTTSLEYPDVELPISVPKGRKNPFDNHEYVDVHHETETETAARETFEETNILPTSIEFLQKAPMIFSWYINGELWRITLFVAKINDSSLPYLDEKNTQQTMEISEVRFYSRDELSKFEDDRCIARILCNWEFLLDDCNTGFHHRYKSGMRQDEQLVSAERYNYLRHVIQGTHRGLTWVL